jgi:hypothetical protein
MHIDGAIAAPDPCGLMTACTRVLQAKAQLAEILVKRDENPIVPSGLVFVVYRVFLR